MKSSRAKELYETLNTCISKLDKENDPDEKIWLALNLDDCKELHNAMVTLMRLYDYTVDVYCAYLDMVDAIEMRKAAQLVKAEDSLTKSVRNMGEVIKSCLMFNEKQNTEVDDAIEEVTLAS
jgi:hypothetical protein